VRRSFAHALFAAGRLADAESEARRTLAHWPGDPVSLVVLAQAENAQGARASAAKALAAARRGWPSGPISIGPAGA
jgi:predicted Zn-dependent protease